MQRGEEITLPLRWRRTYISGDVTKASSALVAAANAEMIQPMDTAEEVSTWRPGDRFAPVTVLQLLHLAPHPKVGLFSRCIQSIQLTHSFKAVHPVDL